MTEKKFNKIVDSVITEVMNEETHFFLTEYHVLEDDTTFGMWGWSKKAEVIKNYVLYVASLKTIVDHNQFNQGTISNDLVDNYILLKKGKKNFLKVIFK